MNCFLLFLFLCGCATVNDARTPQQKNLTHGASEALSSPVDDFISDIDTEESFDDEIDQERTINKNFYKPISISATENMRIREVLTQISNLAGINIFIVHDIEGSMSFSAKNRPFLDILKDICSSSGLKYFIDGNSVKIEIDTPMLKIYNVQSLNFQRDTQSSVSTSTDIFMDQSIGDNKSKAVSNNGSSSVVAGATKNDFWKELELVLKSIVGKDDESYISMHKQGGLVAVCTTQNKHNEIQKYLNLLKCTTETQVLIEAKILEVNLNDEYKSGINWNILRSRGAKLNKNFSSKDGMFSFGVDRNNLSIVSGLIETFGAVKTLSSPRITVLNNQPAVLKVAQNEIIYIPELQRQYATISDNRSTDFLSTTIHTVPIGLMISVLASIDKKNNTILLNLRPTVSRIVRYKDVPFFYQTVSRNNAATGNDVQYHKIPIVDVRELDSVLKLNSGQIVVMGGLMQESSSNNRDGLPNLEEVDFLAGSNEKSTKITELVIFLKATILRKKSNVHHRADAKIYDTFSNDPRPLKFAR